MHDTMLARLDPAWKPWSVPRVVKRAAQAQTRTSRSLIERLDSVATADSVPALPCHSHPQHHRVGQRRGTGGDRRRLSGD